MTDNSATNDPLDENAVESSLPETVAPAAEAAEEQKSGGLSKSLLMGTAVGIGSAAIVAALLYTKRNKK